MKQKNNPLISVCIPVYNTERYLESCLTSVVEQDFTNFEIIVVSDCSKGRDEKGRNCKKICRAFQKKCKIPITFIEHHQNRGILEVRRTAFLASKGDYITYVDSDDQLCPNALHSLYQACTTYNADIVHGTSVGGTFNQNNEFTPSEKNRYSNISYETYENENILHAWLAEKRFTANVWGKLISRSLYQKAFEQIPYTTCNLAEDYLMFFFIGVNAKKYIGIKEKVYLYREVGGMSSGAKIDNLHKWKLLCSCSSVFTIISTWLEENKNADDTYPISNEIINMIKISTRIYLINNYQTYKNCIIPELKNQAYQMLCDYWGEHFVQSVEKEMEK